MSSAPASSATSIRSSSVTGLPRRRLGSTKIPLRSNCQATAPGSAMDPPCFENMARMSAPGAVAVVGQGLDDDRDAARGVALVGDRLVAHALELAGAPLDGPLDGVESAPTRPAPSGTWSAGSGWPSGSPPPSRAATSTWRISLANSLPRALSCRALLVLDRRPLGVTGHRLAPFQKQLVQGAGSPESSGWNDVTSTVPWRQATTGRLTRRTTSRWHRRPAPPRRGRPARRAGPG